MKFIINQKVRLMAGKNAGKVAKIIQLPSRRDGQFYAVLLDNGRGVVYIESDLQAVAEEDERR